MSIMLKGTTIKASNAAPFFAASWIDRATTKPIIAISFASSPKRTKVQIHVVDRASSTCRSTIFTIIPVSKYSCSFGVSCITMLHAAVRR